MSRFREFNCYLFCYSKTAAASHEFFHKIRHYKIFINFRKINVFYLYRILWRCWYSFLIFMCTVKKASSKFLKKFVWRLKKTRVNLRRIQDHSCLKCLVVSPIDSVVVRAARRLVTSRISAGTFKIGESSEIRVKIFMAGGQLLK